MKIEGCAYIFKTRLPYAEEFDRQEVVVIAAGEIVSKVKTENGQTFAAFNSELSRDTRDSDVGELYQGGSW